MELSFGGALRGQVAGGVGSFLGVPYAAPPFGANRLLAPVPAEPWRGVRDATSFGPTPPKDKYPEVVQRLLPERDAPGEECLNLNVWAPAGAGKESAKLPVLVWIPGGSFLNGTGSLAEYDGSAFARDGIVCVTINYRLGAEGFLDLPDADRNRGLLDMVAALRWVRDEIGAFGGDPDTVTIAGESAGAMAIHSLLTMPLADGLFSGAILHSAAAYSTLTPDQAAATAERLGAIADRPVIRAALSELGVEQLVGLTSQTVAALQAPTEAGILGMLEPRFLPFAPVIDGEVLPLDPFDAARRGAGADVPVLVCTNRDEARLFLAPTGALGKVDDATLEAAAAGLYGLSPEGLETYRRNRQGSSPGDVLAAIFGDRSFLLAAVRLAEARAAAGRRTWLSRFDALRLEDNMGLGSCHAADVPFAFGTTDQPALRPRIGERPSVAAAAVLHGAWVAFVKGGDPGWPGYELERRSTALLTDVVTVVGDPAGDERRAWADLSGRRSGQASA